MKYTLAKPDGTLGDTRNFDEAPPSLAPNKGKWLPDNPPTFNLATHVRNLAAVQSVNAAEIAYTVVPRDLSEIKIAKLQQIEVDRDDACLQDVTALGHQWQCDKRSQELLNGAVTLAAAGGPLPTTWRTSDNINIAIDNIGMLLAIAGAMAVQTQTAYQVSWTLKAAVEAASTSEEVDAVMA